MSMHFAVRKDKSACSLVATDFRTQSLRTCEISVVNIKFAQIVEGTELIDWESALQVKTPAEMQPELSIRLETRRDALVCAHALVQRTCSVHLHDME